MTPLTSQALCLAALWALAGGTAQAADPHVNLTVGGTLTPGVYGRIDVGNAPPPPVLYAQPAWGVQPVVVTRMAPVYLYVPPGHAKKWAKHCHKYSACAQPVYFVQVDAKGYRP